MAIFVADTGIVLAVNVAVVPAAATVTEVGTVTQPRLEVRVTVMPPLGAGPLIVTVPADEAPP